MENEILQAIKGLQDQMVQMEERLDGKIDRLDAKIDAQSAAIQKTIVQNNVEIGELIAEALEPMVEDIREIRNDTVKNTLDIARLKLAK